MMVFAAVGALIREAECIDGISLAKNHARTSRTRQKSKPTELVVVNSDSEWN